MLLQVTRLLLLPWRNHVQVVTLITDQQGVGYLHLCHFLQDSITVIAYWLWCSTDFHTGSSCQNRDGSQSRLCQGKGEASNMHLVLASGSIILSSPSPCPMCWTTTFSFTFSGSIVMCTSLWILIMNLMIKFCPMQLLTTQMTEDCV